MGIGDIARGAFQISCIHIPQKSFCIHECSTKIRKNSSVLKKSRTFFRMSEMPLVKFEKIGKLYRKVRYPQVRSKLQ